MYAEVASAIQRIGVTADAFAGSVLKRRNRKQFYNLHNAWLTLLSDSPLDPKKPLRVLRKFSREYVDDPKGQILKMAALADRLLSGLSEDSAGYITIPFISEFADTPIFREFVAFHKTGDPLILRFLLSFLWFGKKGEFEDPDLIPVAFRKWEELEDNLRVDFDVTLYVKTLREVLESYIPALVDTTMLPVHGSGVVAEKGIGRDIEAKNNIIGFDPRVHRALFARHSNDPSRLVAQWDSRIKVSQTRSKLFFVRKTAKTARSICFEPATFMLAQQAVRLLLERTIKEGPLGRHIFIDDQTVNLLAAQYGSETRRVDTIDLSSASDSVSWGLIKRVVPPKVRYYLQATRTREVELPNGQIRSLRKFAPMGSALCFPTQCIIYAGIVITASLLWGIKVGRLKGIGNPYLSFQKLSSGRLGGSLDALEPFYVYGDDIICDSRVTPIVNDILRALGFSVNVEKSFAGRSPFRESCGGFFYNGSDVTPLLYRLPREEDGITAQSLAAVVDHVNRVGDYGYRNLHTFFLRYALDLKIPGVPKVKGKNPLFFTSAEYPEPFAIFSVKPMNEHLLHKEYVPLAHGINCECERCSSRWQRFQKTYVKCLRPIVTERRDSTHDIYHFIQWQRSKYGREVKNPPVFAGGTTRSLPYEAGIGWGWMPA
jgi:nitrogen fixation-related uncharacterized protein